MRAAQPKIRNHAVARADYARDYCGWVTAQVRALRRRDAEQIDWDNLAEEVGSLGRQEEQRLQSQLARVFEHALKLRHATRVAFDRDARAWRIGIRNARRHASKILRENPSLKRKLPAILADAYLDGRDAAMAALDLPERDIPETTPWTAAQVLESDLLLAEK